MKNHVFTTVDDFSPHSRRLRREFDQNFKDPHHAHPKRFVWDFWHIPGEYTVMRTPAYHYFQARLYNSFHSHLVSWGRQNLGCHDVSPPWLSCYVSGCRQEEHVDRPHGPLAFVYSLTDWGNRRFKGGETFLQLSNGKQKLIAPEFNRLTLFNPSVPHGVREVTGNLDPRWGRLVIHGWFVNPRPFWTGPLETRDVQAGLDEGLSRVLEGDLQIGQGLLSLRLRIGPDGDVRMIQPLVQTVREARTREINELLRRLHGLRFPKKKKGTVLTLPLIFE